MFYPMLVKAICNLHCLGEGPPLEDGYIEPSVPSEEVRQEPYPLPSGFEWSTLDLNDDHQVCVSVVLLHIII